MLFSELIIVYYDHRVRHFSGQNVEFYYVKVGNAFRTTGFEGLLKLSVSRSPVLTLTWHT
jgi:hypothetical protein